MADKEKLLQLIGNFNDNGLDMIMKFVLMFDGVEEYNIRTTPERLEELKKIEEHERIQNAEQQEKIMYDRAVAERTRQQKFKESLMGKEKHLFETVNNVKINARYTMQAWELRLLADTYNNNLIDGSWDIFRYGYIKGERSERARRKKVQA